MKVKQVKESKEGSHVRFKAIVLKKKGEVRYKVFDKTGEVWVESEHPLEEGKAYELWGVFKGGVVFCEGFEPLKEVKLEDFLPVSPNIRENSERFWQLVEGIGNPKLREAVERVFREVWEEFTKGIAARKYHHAYIGGLLEHTVRVAEIARKLSEFYPVDRDVVLAAALLHDVGKSKEMNTFPKFEYDPTYSLMGHIYLGSHWFQRAASEVGLDGDTTFKVVHCILAHHGSHSKGSPVEPKIPEAWIVHLADNLDAQMNHILRDEDP